MKRPLTASVIWMKLSGLGSSEHAARQEARNEQTEHRYAGCRAEMDSVLSRYGTPGVTERRAGFEVFLSRRRIRTSCCGAQWDRRNCAAAATATADRPPMEWKCCVNFGVVGGLTEEMSRTKTCVVTQVVHYDFDLSGIDPVSPASTPDLRTSTSLLIPLMEKAWAVCPELIAGKLCLGG